MLVFFFCCRVEGSVVVVVVGGCTGGMFGVKDKGLRNPYPTRPTDRSLLLFKIYMYIYTIYYYYRRGHGNDPATTDLNSAPPPLPQNPRDRGRRRRWRTAAALDGRRREIGLFVSYDRKIRGVDDAALCVYKLLNGKAEGFRMAGTFF